MSDKTDWEPTPESTAAAAAHLARIAEHHATAPKCRLCGQPTASPAKYGLCSKTSPSHAEFRSQARAAARARA